MGPADKQGELRRGRECYQGVTKKLLQSGNVTEKFDRIETPAGLYSFLMKSS